MNILTFDKLIYEKETTHISSSTYVVCANDMNKDLYPYLRFEHSKFLEFDYPQSWDEHGDGSTFYEIPYAESNSYELTLLGNAIDSPIGRFMDDLLGKYLVIEAEYIDLISNNLESIYSQILDIFEKYNVKEKINPYDYKLILLDEYNSKMKENEMFKSYDTSIN